ncbi:hypothetical protein C8R47DRAFT_764596 [Mycena vitilis]|nr:hypothetical protein C8R47DRAFT_764596 [Mycena vitilis]
MVLFTKSYISLAVTALISSLHVFADSEFQWNTTSLTGSLVSQDYSALFEVPLDYSSPAAGTASIAIVRSSNRLLNHVSWASFCDQRDTELRCARRVATRYARRRWAPRKNDKVPPLHILEPARPVFVEMPRTGRGRLGLYEEKQLTFAFSVK